MVNLARVVDYDDTWQERLEKREPIFPESGKPMLEMRFQTAIKMQI